MLSAGINKHETFSTACLGSRGSPGGRTHAALTLHTFLYRSYLQVASAFILITHIYLSKGRVLHNISEIPIVKAGHQGSYVSSASFCDSTLGIWERFTNKASLKFPRTQALIHRLSLQITRLTTSFPEV
jgi:hypothetical protein